MVGAAGGSPEELPRAPRIVCLLPSITEIVAALGFSDGIVGITHECDFPPEAIAGAAVVTKSEISPYSMSQGWAAGCKRSIAGRC